MLLACSETKKKKKVPLLNHPILINFSKMSVVMTEGLSMTEGLITLAGTDNLKIFTKMFQNKQ